MNKFKFSFKIKELEVQIEGTREDVSTITNNIGQQFKGLMKPVDLGDQTIEKSPLSVTEDGEITEINAAPRKRKSANAKSRGDKAKAYDFKNDLSKFGAPVQSWTGLEKSTWLLYVMQNILEISELTAGEISETFNKHFKQQGTIRPSNVSRDFGKQKAGAKALVGENSTITPSKWYLTEEGSKSVQKLIQNLKSSEG